MGMRIIPLSSHFASHFCVIALAVTLVGCTPDPIPMEAVQQCTNAGGSADYYSNGTVTKFECHMPGDPQKGKF